MSQVWAGHPYFFVDVLDGSVYFGGWHAIMCDGRGKYGSVIKI